MFNTLMKKNGKKGFTLMELLIVVAIIAILVAISIPVFSAQLEKARESTDVANVRAAKAAAVTELLTNEAVSTAESSTVYYYDAVNGKLLDATTAKTNITQGYGKGTTKDAKIDTENGSKKVSGNVIKVTIDTDGNAKCEWVALNSIS